MGIQQHQDEHVRAYEMDLALNRIAESMKDGTFGQLVIDYPNEFRGRGRTILKAHDYPSAIGWRGWKDD